MYPFRSRLARERRFGIGQHVSLFVVQPEGCDQMGVPQFLDHLQGSKLVLTELATHPLEEVSWDVIGRYCLSGVDSAELRRPRMNFNGSIYLGDRIVFRDVLGSYSGQGGILTGVFVLAVGQELLLGGCYTLLTDGGRVQNVCVMHSVGEAHQAKLVQFVGARAMIAATERATVQGDDEASAISRQDRPA